MKAIPGTLAARTQAALARFALMRRQCGPRMRLQVYDGYPTVSVVRGDDAMLVTPYMRFFIGSNSPTFEFRSREAPKMFTRYTRHFESTWTGSAAQAQEVHPRTGPDARRLLLRLILRRHPAQRHDRPSHQRREPRPRPIFNGGG
jgi:hypothetical protein